MPSDVQKRQSKKKPAGSSQLLGSVISVVLMGVFLYAGQAQFTDTLTPELAKEIDRQTAACYKVLKPLLPADLETTKKMFGGYNFVAAALLLSHNTRRLGLAMALFGFGINAYSQHTAGAGEEIYPVAAWFGLSLLGFLVA